MISVLCVHAPRLKMQTNCNEPKKQQYAPSDFVVGAPHTFRSLMFFSVPCARESCIFSTRSLPWQNVNLESLNFNLRRFISCIKFMKFEPPRIHNRTKVSQGQPPLVLPSIKHDGSYSGQPLATWGASGLSLRVKSRHSANMSNMELLQRIKMQRTPRSFWRFSGSYINLGSNMDASLSYEPLRTCMYG